MTTFGTYRGISGPNSRQAECFPDPFMDAASLHMPENIIDANRWCEFLAMAMGEYAAALRRLIAYFVTDIEIIGQDRHEKIKYKDFLNDELNLPAVLPIIGFDYLVYGNSFTTWIIPIKRYLYCPKCKLELPLRIIGETPEFRFSWSNFQFMAHCPRCMYDGPWPHNDRRSTDASDMRIKRWSPHEMELLWDPITDDTSYIWKIPPEYMRMIKEGTLFHLERWNWEVIEAVRDNRYIRFDKDVVYHMKDETLAGVRNKGWGISRMLANFRQAWYVQVVRRFNEAIALDYIVPMRVITPAPRSGGEGAGVSDPALTTNLGGFAGRVGRMLRDHRRNPAGWNVLPFPIQYQVVGGDATKLAPADLLEQGHDHLLTAIGMPIEFYKGSITMQNAAPGLRLVESNWSHIPYNLNRFLNFGMRKISQLRNWEPYKARLASPRIVDDLNKQMAKLQLMMGRQISQTSGLASVNLDFEEEQRRLIEEQVFVANEQTRAQEQQEQAAQAKDLFPTQSQQMIAGMQQQQAGGQQGGQPGDPNAQAGGGMQMPPASMKPQTPEEMMANAESTASQLLTMPETQRKSQLIALGRSDKVTHDLVVAIMDDKRQAAQREGGQQVMAQQYPQAG